MWFKGHHGHTGVVYERVDSAACLVRPIPAIVHCEFRAPRGKSASPKRHIVSRQSSKYGVHQSGWTQQLGPSANDELRRINTAIDPTDILARRSGPPDYGP